jgi:PiT family inorganic phosphate transporter
MFASPLLGFMLGMLVMGLLFALLRNTRPYTVNRIFGKAQLGSAMAMGFMHGTNDAQKTMGIIALALAAGTANGRLDDLPAWLDFLHTAPAEPGKSLAIATWIKLLCAVVMAAGTASGGWRIIKTLGHKMVRLQPVHGFAAEASSAGIIGLASHFGFPVSTTHTVSSAIMGVGAAKRFSALRWTVVESMVWAWVLTIPVSATIAYLLMSCLKAFGYDH